MFVSKNMLINAQHTGQVRVAIVDGTTLESYQVDVAESGLTRGNIYRGIVANIQPSLNAAFIDIGEEKHGFLSLDDIEPAAYHKKPPEEGKPRIDQVLERKKPILVQVTKDGMGSKGPALTTNLSLAGRYLVMMPLDKVRGISRKIDDDQLRKTVKGRLAKLAVPEGMGVIVRTNGLDQTQTMLNRDLNALVRLWTRIETESRTGKGSRLLYNDQDLILQALRDFLDSSIGQVIVDTDEAHSRSERFMKTFMPRSKTELVRYDERLPLFSRYHLENQIDRIYSRSVPLASGGSIVIDPTEALTAIDVNSGRATKKADHDESILTVNLEAADEVGRQLRLRDIGGLVVIDFIDMRLRKHQRKVEKAMRDALKSDRARHTVSKISANGLVEINRQRLKQALRSRIHRTCPTCDGVGSIPSLEFAAISLLRRIEARAAIGNLAGVVVGLHPEVADALQNHHRREIAALEEEFDLRIEVIAASNLHRTEERVEWKQDRESHRTADTRALTAVDLASAATRRRRKRGATPIDVPEPAVAEATAPPGDDGADEAPPPKKRRRRRGGRGRRKNRSQASEGSSAAPAQGQAGQGQAEAKKIVGPPRPAGPQGGDPSSNEDDAKGRRRKRGGRSRGKTRGGKPKLVVHEEDGYIDDNSQLRFFGATKPGAPAEAELPPSNIGNVGKGRRGGRRKAKPEPYIGPMAPAGAVVRPRPGAFGSNLKLDESDATPVDDNIGNVADAAPRTAPAEHGNVAPPHGRDETTDAAETMGNVATGEQAAVPVAPAEADEKANRTRGGRRKQADDAAPAEAAAEAPASQAGPAAADEEPKRKRGGRRRKADDVAPAEALAEAPASQAAPAETDEKAKRTRGGRRKQADDAAPAEAVAEAPASQAAPTGEGSPDAAAEKPKRKRTTRRKKADDTATAEAAAPAAPTDEAAEKPKRKRTTRRKKADDADAGELPEAAADADEKPKRKRGGRRKKADDGLADLPSSPPPPPAADAVVADAPWPWWRAAPPADSSDGDDA